MTAHDADSPLKRFAVDPPFAVERDIRQPVEWENETGASHADPLLMWTDRARAAGKTGDVVSNRAAAVA